MATVTRLKLSASTDYRGIKVAATATPGTTIHTAGAVAATVGADELYLWAENFDTVGRRLTLEWGGTTSPDDLMTFDVPAKTQLLVVGGNCITNSLLVRAFADAANIFMITGYVNRIVN